MALAALRTAVAGGEQPSRDALVASLSNDLEGPRRSEALHGLCDMLGEFTGVAHDTAAVAEYPACWACSHRRRCVLEIEAGFFEVAQKPYVAQSKEATCWAMQPSFRHLSTYRIAEWCEMRGAV